MSFELLYNTSEAHKAIAEAIAGQWREQLGVGERAVGLKILKGRRVATLLRQKLAVLRDTA